MPAVLHRRAVWCSIQGSGFRGQGAGCRVQGAGFRVQGSGFRVQGDAHGVAPPSCGKESSHTGAGRRHLTIDVQQLPFGAEQNLLRISKFPAPMTTVDMTF